MTQVVMRTNVSDRQSVPLDRRSRDCRSLTVEFAPSGAAGTPMRIGSSAGRAPNRSFALWDLVLGGVLAGRGYSWMHLRCPAAPAAEVSLSAGASRSEDSQHAAGTAYDAPRAR
jgi:hypothetical protein